MNIYVVAAGGTFAARQAGAQLDSTGTPAAAWFLVSTTVALIASGVQGVEVDHIYLASYNAG